MRLVFAIVTAALCLPSNAASALTADEVVARYIQARGGLPKLGAINSLRLTGKAVFGFGDTQIEASWGALQKRPAMIRTEVSLQGLSAVEAYDGKEGWNLDPFGGRREAQRASADDSKSRAQAADIDGPLVNWREKGHRVEYLGTEDVDGTPAHKLRVTLKDGDTRTIFLDPDYFLEIRTVTETHIRGTERVSQTDLGSYEQVEGVWIPFSIESGPKGGPRTARITIERAEVNVASDDAVFHFPPAGSTISRAIQAAPSAPGATPAATKPPPPAAAGAPVFDAGALSGLGVRNIGSATMSGRVSAVAARNEGGKTTLFVGAASG